MIRSRQNVVAVPAVRRLDAYWEESMTESRIYKRLLVVVLMYAFTVLVSPASAQQDGADDRPLTQKEFAEFLEEYRSFKADVGKLQEETYLRRPRSVRVDKEFRLFVADYESYRIQIYQKDAIPLDQETMAASIRNPTLATT